MPDYIYGIKTTGYRCDKLIKGDEKLIKNIWKALSNKKISYLCDKIYNELNLLKYDLDYNSGYHRRIDCGKNHGTSRSGMLG
jgi:hypothetical protein